MKRKYLCQYGYAILVKAEYRIGDCLPVIGRIEAIIDISKKLTIKGEKHEPEYETF
jgi:hypothetical protein